MVTQITDVVDSEVLFTTVFEPTLTMVGCKNVFPFPLRPILEDSELMDILQLSEGDDQDKLEAWFMNRTGIKHEDVGGSLEYIQIQTWTISGFAWHVDMESSRQYIQDITDKLCRTFERNKNASLHGDVEIHDIVANYIPEQIGSIFTYSSKITLTIRLRVRDGVRISS